MNQAFQFKVFVYVAIHLFEGWHTFTIKAIMLNDLSIIGGEHTILNRKYHKNCVAWKIKIILSKNRIFFLSSININIFYSFNRSFDKISKMKLYELHSLSIVDSKANAKYTNTIISLNKPKKKQIELVINRATTVQIK